MDDERTFESSLEELVRKALFGYPRRDDISKLLARLDELERRVEALRK